MTSKNGFAALRSRDDPACPFRGYMFIPSCGQFDGPYSECFGILNHEGGHINVMEYALGKGSLATRLGHGHKHSGQHR